MFLLLPPGAKGIREEVLSLQLNLFYYVRLIRKNFKCKQIRHVSVQSLGCYVLTRLNTKSSIFWDITPCSQIKFTRCFGEIYYIHLQYRKVNQANNQQEACRRQSERHADTTGSSQGWRKYVNHYFCS
jgi:hypothetical protein